MDIPKRLHTSTYIAIHFWYGKLTVIKTSIHLGLNCTHRGTSCQRRRRVHWDNVGADYQIQVVSWYSKYHGQYILKRSDQVKIFQCNEVCHLATAASTTPTNAKRNKHVIITSKRQVFTLCVCWAISTLSWSQVTLTRLEIRYSNELRWLDSDKRVPG